MSITYSASVVTHRAQSPWSVKVSPDWLAVLRHSVEGFGEAALAGGHWRAVPCPAPGPHLRQVAERQSGASHLSERSWHCLFFGVGKEHSMWPQGPGAQAGAWGLRGSLTACPLSWSGHRTSASKWPSLRVWCRSPTLSRTSKTWRTSNLPQRRPLLALSW